jgi:hypothetical protein
LKPFILNSSQRKLVAEFERQRKLGIPIRVIILKARQIGFSTVTEAYILWLLIRNPNTKAVTLAHEADASSNLFEMFTRFYDNLPAPFKPGQDSRNEALGFLHFALPLDSGIEIKTAANPNAGRGNTFQYCHASEVAFWENPQTFRSLKQAIPNVPNSFLAEESTANGPQGIYYEDWVLAKAGKNGFVPFFVAWWEHEEYRHQTTPLEDVEWTRFRDKAKECKDKYGTDWKKHFRFESKVLELKDFEIEWAFLYPIDFGQIKWTRWCIPFNCQDDLTVFATDFPGCEEDAFLGTGRPAFDPVVLVMLKRELQSEDYAGPRPIRYTIDEVASEEQGIPVIHEDPWGELDVYELPQKDVDYSIGADVAEGTVDGDFDAAHVVANESFSHCAQLHGKFDPDIFGKKLYWLATWYNDALLGVERNAAGQATIQTLVGMEYYNLYGDGWPYRSKITTFGWRTDIRTRKPMVMHLKRAIKEGSFKPRSVELIDEMLIAIVNEKGKEEAPRTKGAHDDLWMSAGVTCEMRELAVGQEPLAYT